MSPGGYACSELQLTFRQILDQEEEIAQSEFEKLEKRLGHDPQSEKRDSR